MEALTVDDSMEDYQLCDPCADNTKNYERTKYRP